MKLWPKSLAGRLAALLILTLVIAQIVTFALFSGERISAFREVHREDILARLGALVELLEEAPSDLHERLVMATSSGGFRVALSETPDVESNADDDARLRNQLAEATGRPVEDVYVKVERRGPPWRWRRERDERRGPPGPRHRPPPWAEASIMLTDGTWLNAEVQPPPIPRLGVAFLASFVISAAAVGAVGAFGVRLASAPLRRLAGAADRLGRGERFEPLPETGPEETRQANVAFNRMRERIDRFVRDRTAMLAAIAHDLRTPITSLRLRAEFVDDEETKEKILETLAEMQAMTDAVLAFARGDAESEETRRIDVTALAESLVEDAAESGRDVTFEDSPPVTLTCRQLALKRAIGNLLDNAGFYGTRARVRVERAADEVRIVVDDDGPGIPEAQLEHVFDPFVRLEGSRSRETGGAGLGLAITRSIARAHGGDVRLENRAEGGLRAVLSLPA
jgi:signal transduction histidine kinase